MLPPALTYQTTNGTVTFPTGNISQSIPVTICGDTVDELDELFTVTLSSPTNTTLGTATAQVTIADDDTGVVSIGDQNLIEGQSGSSPMTFTVSLSVPNSQTVTVQASPANGSATAGSDYTAVSSQTVTFAPGETTKPLAVRVLGDTTDEPNETFTVTLSNPTNATISGTQGSATGTILDDAGLPSLSVTGTQVIEPASGSTNATVTATLLPASGLVVTVQVSTANGTATTAGDYTALTNQTVTFNAGETSKPVSIAILGDTIPEGNATFLVNLSQPVNSAIARGQATVTILDDDSSPVLTREREKPNRKNNDTGQHDGMHTEGQVIRIDARSDPPIIVIQGGDGEIELRLRGEARNAVGGISVGDYLSADGDKQHDGLSEVDEIDVEDEPSRVPRAVSSALARRSAGCVHANPGERCAVIVSRSRWSTVQS